MASIDLAYNNALSLSDLGFDTTDASSTAVQQDTSASQTGRGSFSGRGVGVTERGRGGERGRGRGGRGGTVASSGLLGRGENANVAASGGGEQHERKWDNYQSDEAPNMKRFKSWNGSPAAPLQTAISNASSTLPSFTAGAPISPFANKTPDEQYRMLLQRRTPQMESRLKECLLKPSPKCPVAEAINNYFASTEGQQQPQQPQQPQPTVPTAALDPVTAKKDLLDMFGTDNVVSLPFSDFGEEEYTRVHGLADDVQVSWYRNPQNAAGRTRMQNCIKSNGGPGCPKKTVMEMYQSVSNADLISARQLSDGRITSITYADDDEF